MARVNASQERPAAAQNGLLRFFRVVPLFAFVLGVYTLFMTTGVDMMRPRLEVTVISGANLVVTGNDLFLVGVVILLFFELIKATNATQQSIFIEHILSTLVFVGFVIMLITVKACGNATFLILTLMSLLDVLAGWTITYKTGLRDWAGPERH
jgi:hypothetical protein